MTDLCIQCIAFTKGTGQRSIAAVRSPDNRTELLLNDEV